MPHPLSQAPLHPVARLRSVTKRLGGRPVLDRLDLDIRAGEVTALLGPNGAGKTTSVGVLIGRLTPDGGAAELFGLDARRPAARSRMGVMLQSAELADVLSVEELVRLQSGLYPDPLPVAKTIELAGLTGLERRRAGQLSGGQSRRLQYALAICGRPDLLVLDEPTTGLDPEARRQLWATVRAAADRGAAVLLTTHHLDEADALADRVVVIEGGRIVADASPDTIKRRVAGSTLRCRTALSVTALRALPAVRGVHEDGTGRTLHSADAVATVRALLAANPALTDLTVAAASLEDALAGLSSHTLKEAA